MNDQSTDVVAVEHVVIALVDLFKGVPLRDQFFQFELTVVEQTEQHRDVVGRVAVTEYCSTNGLLVET